MSRITSKIYNFDIFIGNKSLILNSEKGNHKKLGFSLYYFFFFKISSAGHNEKGTVNDHYCSRGANF